MHIPKYFIKWLRLHGYFDDLWSSLDMWQRHNIDRIAYRAYRKGRKDEKAKTN